MALAPITLQSLVGEGNAAYVEALTRIIKGMPIIDVAGAPTPSWVARKGTLGWEFPTDAEMYAHGEAANPLLIDPTALTLPSNIATYNFSVYRKVRTVAPVAATTIAASTMTAVQSRWPSGGMIKFPMGATAFAVTPAGTYTEHGRPTTWVANRDYIALILKFDVAHVFWLAPGERH